MSGSQEKIRLLLNQRDPATLGRLMRYYDYLNDYRAENIAAVSDEIRKLDAAARPDRGGGGSSRRAGQDSATPNWRAEPVAGRPYDAARVAAEKKWTPREKRSRDSPRRKKT